MKRRRWLYQMWMVFAFLLAVGSILWYFSHKSRPSLRSFQSEHPLRQTLAKRLRHKQWLSIRILRWKRWDGTSILWDRVRAVVRVDVPQTYTTFLFHERGPSTARVMRQGSDVKGQKAVRAARRHWYMWKQEVSWLFPYTVLFKRESLIHVFQHKETSEICALSKHTKRIDCFWLDRQLRPIRWRFWQEGSLLSGLAFSLGGWRWSGPIPWSSRRKGLLVRWSWPSLHMSREHSDSNTRLFSSIKRPDKQMVVGVGDLSLWGVFLGALCLLLVSRLLLVRFLPLRRDMIVFPSELEHPLKYGYIRRGCMSKALCSQCISVAEAGSWTKERHTQATQDQRIDTLPAIYDDLTACLRKDILPLVASLYRFPVEQLGVKEAFIVKYDEHVQCKLDLHRDASILTCSIALNDRADYVGGGMYFPSIEEVITLERAGDMLVHCGKVQHGGYSVKKGVRYLLVCFVDCAAVDILDHREIATWNSAEPSDREVMKRLFLR